MFWMVLALVFHISHVESTPGFTLVANAKECAGSELNIGNLKTVEECAARCAGGSSMFIFGTNDNGVNRCKKKYRWWGDVQCPCYCETAANTRGECKIITHPGYKLYRYNVQVPELCPISLPQYMTDKVCLKANKVNLYKARMFYKFTKPSEDLHFPRLNQPENIVKAKLAFDPSINLSTAQKVVVGIANKIKAALNAAFKGIQLQSYKQYEVICDKFVSTLKKLPFGREVDMPSEHEGFTEVISNGKWQDDKIFAQKRLAGVCPYFLQQVTNSDHIGMKREKFESIANPSFDWNKAVSRAIGESHITSLSKAISAGRVYVLYHEYFNKLPTTPSHEAGRTPIKATSTLTLFVTDKHGDLTVVAIQEDCKKDSKVHTPKSSKYEWEKAKALVEMEQTGVCQDIGHFYECHVRMEIMCNAHAKHMSPTHPLYQPMRHHCAGTESLGYFGGGQVLLRKGGLFDEIFDFGVKGAKLMLNDMFDTDHYDNLDMELRLRKQGLINDNLKYYPYRDDGLVLWKAVKVFAERMIDAHYISDDDVAKDFELQGYLNELSRDGKKGPDGGNGRLRGFPTSMKTRKELVGFFSRFLYPIIHHHAANYPIYPYSTFYPMHAGLMYEPKGEKTLLKAMPNSTTVITHAAFGAMLASLRMNKIFDYFDHLADDKSRAIVQDTFRYFYTKIQPVLAARNAKRFKEGKLTFQYFEPNWLTNSIHT